MAGSPAETRTRGHLSEARLPLSPLLRMLELFVFYDGRVPGSELSAEGFNIRRLEAEGFIFRTGSHFDFGCYLIGPALERYAALGGCGPGGQKRETEGSEKTALIEPLSIPKAGDIRSAGVATGRRHPYVRGGDSLSSQERLDN